MSEKASGFGVMAAFKAAMKIPIIDETLIGNAKNQTFLFSQLEAALGTTGTYTPSTTNVANITGSFSSLDFKWVKIGSRVTVTGGFQVINTSLGVITKLRISLPFASTLTNDTFELSGTGSPGRGSAPSSITFMEAGVIIYANQNEAEFLWLGQAAAGINQITFTFTYDVV